ncbi:hypothetical protein EJ05DRAFT_474094 [Pseudovirgaria hyperparasitica]|uniref:Lipoprotein n=1 Tax=Pseudovirgaria hyperparasitica TaxID=470096 RepID=A0A6A6WGD3_9PEZI|nr:uncharacterized protein EJ05DRAFT_474094 [Pseudovirgaria hyperparasitica]KAF2760201.1 hypothetical protein EJ05DRAFT_474094 [Pseudovirgaria hyperparasitica]
MSSVAAQFGIVIAVLVGAGGVTAAGCAISSIVDPPSDQTSYYRPDANQANYMREVREQNVDMLAREAGMRTKAAMDRRMRESH